MSEAMIAYGACFACGRMFTFNPNWVPSVPIDPQTRRPPDVGADGLHCEPDRAAVARAVREPLCESCVELWNAARVRRGEQPISVHPRAYEAESSLDVDW
jgi:hypothetical protein